MLIVGHFVVAGVIAAEDWWPNSPVLLDGGDLDCGRRRAPAAMLPRVKGALIGYQWAMRMHGFGGAEPNPT